MIPLVEVPESSFSTLAELREDLAHQDRRIYEVPLHKISLGQDGVLQAGGFEGPLAPPALWGLLRCEGIPLDFASHRCPTDLLPVIVGRLAQELATSVLVQAVNGVATSIMPVNRKPVRHDVLIDRLGVGRPIREATLSVDCLRITAVNDQPRELLPRDAFSSGWELVTSETGWRSVEAWRWVVREICTNGLVGFDNAAIFKRGYSSREAVLVSVERLVGVLENATRSSHLAPAIRWAAGRRLGTEHELVVNYLSHRLGADAAKQELSQVNADTSWYDLLNVITSVARLHHLDVRRRYEAEGGLLLNWFSREGRGRPLWRRDACQRCLAWSNDPDEPDAHDMELTE